MTTRELKRDEWIPFFSAFSRRYRGQPITIQVAGSTPDERAQTVARRVPLIGITAERGAQPESVRAIQITVADSADEHLTHVVGAPVRLRVAQVSNGADELLLIDASAGPTTTVDFSTSGLDDLGRDEHPDGHDRSAENADSDLFLQ